MRQKAQEAEYTGAGGWGAAHLTKKGDGQIEASREWATFWHETAGALPSSSALVEQATREKGLIPR